MKTTQNQIIQVNCYELCCIKNNIVFLSVQKRVTSRDIEIKPNRIGETQNRCWSRSQTSIGQMANKSSSKNHSVDRGSGCGRAVVVVEVATADTHVHNKRRIISYVLLDSRLYTYTLTLTVAIEARRENLAADHIKSNCSSYLIRPHFVFLSFCY